jgi:hypothetical protein
MRPPQPEEAEMPTVEGVPDCFKTVHAEHGP